MNTGTKGSPRFNNCDIYKNLALMGLAGGGGADHRPHTGSSEHGNHDLEPQSGQSPPGQGQA